MLQNLLFLAHLEPVVAEVPRVQSSLPVYGTWQISLLFILAGVIGVWIFYRIFDALPRYTKLTDRHEVRLIKIMIASILGGLLAASWDVWWHRAIGRDTFWEAPHMFLYSFSIIGILIGLYIWRHTNEKIWKHIVLLLLVVPISAPFDNMWHILFGVEDLSSPISLSWSPPHAFLTLAVLIALSMILKALHKHHKVKDESFFGGIVFAAIFGTGMFLVMPFHPTEGWGQIAGFWGAGVLTALYVGVVLAAQHWMKSTSAAGSWMTIAALIMMSMSYSKDTAPGIILMPHDRPPFWVYVFAFLVTAAVLDYTKGKMSLWLRAMFAGGFWAIILFGFTASFSIPEFQYGFDKVIIATFSGLVGGLLAAVIYRLITKKSST